MTAELQLLKADQAARDAAIEIDCSLIVQAPAGSGKTELLIQRYLTLLASVDNPEEILAITFTLKAASEMRLRVVNALLRASNNEEPSEPHELITHIAARQVLERDSKLDWRLMQSPRRMRIQTLDAFGAGVARSLPLSSGLGQIGQTLVDEELDLLRRAAAAATLDWLDSGDDRSRDVEQVLRHLDNNTSIYIRYVARMLAARDQWLSIVGGEAVNESDASVARSRIEHSIERMISLHLGKIRAQIAADRVPHLVDLAAYAARNLRDSENLAHPVASLFGMSELPGSDASDLPAWRAVASLLLIKDGSWRRSINKNDGFPAPGKERKRDLYALIGDLGNVGGLAELLHRTRILPAPKYRDDQWSVLLALFQVLRLGVSELRRLFDERGLSDHTEVALAAGAALGTADEPGDVTLMLDYRLRHLLVDEMQDTSTGQYQLLEKLLAGWQPDDGRTIFCVGDPMQSIYRFRDAQVGRFVQVQRTGIGGVPMKALTLRQNFRSGENLVHWFNTVFAQIMPLEDDIAAASIAYSESLPGPAHRGEGECVVHPLIDATTDVEAEAGLQMIRACMQQYSDDSKAILVRSRTHLRALLPKLKRAGIPFQSIEIDRLTDLPEIIDVLALTRAMCHEADRLAWLALLRGPWVGLNWLDLHALVKNDTKSSVLELLADDRRVACLSEDGRNRAGQFSTTIRKHLQGSATQSLRERIELTWFALAGPALLRDADQINNVYRYFDVIERLESAGTLADVSELERQLDAERVSSPGAGSGQLQIMTMHKAKGLEFDHVFLIGLGRIPRVRQKPVLAWLNLPDEERGNTIIVSPVGARAELESDPLHQYIEAVEKDKSRFELERLLYVACTRARKSLHLLGNARRTSDGSALKPPDPNSLLHRIWPLVAGEFEAALSRDHVSDVVDDSDNRSLVEPLLKRLRRQWLQPEAPALPVRNDMPDTDTGDRPVDFYWVGSAARHAGTIIHRRLQRMTHPSTAGRVTDLEGMRRSNAVWARQLGVPEEQIDEVCERVTVALSNTLNDENGRWLLEGKGHAELAVTGLRDGKPQSIVIDRVRIADDGTHWIVDYKSSSHEGGDLPGFLQQESDRYREQLSTYHAVYSQLVDAPVRTALYFPLLQEFCEVDVGG